MRQILKDADYRMLIINAILMGAIFLYGNICYRQGYAQAKYECDGLTQTVTCTCECDSKVEEPPVIADPVEETPEIVEPEEKPVEESKEVVSEFDLTQEEIELIALLTMAEAEAEPVEGQRLVIDTVLNRMDSPYFPDTVYEVIYQRNQFTSMTGSRVTRCYVRDDLVELVKEELVSRYNSECIFFRTKQYHKWGVPMFQVGNHYFSSYD